MNHIASWVKWQHCLLKAKYKLRRNTVSQAAAAMFLLNRSAASGGEREMTYAYKGKFVRYLYENDYCTAVSEQIQTLHCYACDGTGEYVPGRECNRCLGDGVYRKIRLYRFVFDIKGIMYVWHQPVHLLRYPVKLTESGETNYDGRRSDIQPLSADDVRPLLAIMDVFLSKNGEYIAVESHRTGKAPLRDIAHFQLTRYILNTKYRIRNIRMYGLTNFSTITKDDDIPF